MENTQKQPLYKRTWFLIVMCIFFPPVGAVLLWVAKRPQKQWVRIILTVILAFDTLLAFVPRSDSEKESTTVETVQQPDEKHDKTNAKEDTQKDTTDTAKEDSKEEIETNTTDVAEAEASITADVEDELTVLRKELKEKYDVSEPMTFVRGDVTGDWRIVKVASSSPVTDYAVDYARAYMMDNASSTNVHYIVNFTLKTTSQLRIVLGKLFVKTTEYVEDEEHDAKVIGDGLLLGENSYDLETGEEIVVKVDESAGVVSGDELVSAVKQAIDGSVGQGIQISDVTFDSSDLTVKVDMSGADTSLLSAKDLAEVSISSITDEILDLDDAYYNTWTTITMDFGEIGKATFQKKDVEDQGFGKFFDVPVGILK